MPRRPKSCNVSPLTAPHRPSLVPDRLVLGMAATFILTLAALQAREQDGSATRIMSRFVAPSASAASDRLSAQFTMCHTGGGNNCVVDGDTFWFAGQKIRIADIDTPETHAPRCDDERARGEAATRRMHHLLNAGPFTLAVQGRETDRYGRALRIVSRGGESLGGVLVNEGLARWYDGGRQPWC